MLHCAVVTFSHSVRGFCRQSHRHFAACNQDGPVLLSGAVGTDHSGFRHRVQPRSSPKRVDFYSTRTLHPTAVVVTVCRRLGRTLCIEEKMDDATGDAEGFSDLQGVVGSGTSRRAKTNSWRMLVLSHGFSLPMNLQGKMAERSKACDSSDWV